MLKIIHTADLHLGRALSEYPSNKENQKFFDYLVSVICDQNVDALLISGDIFQHARPSELSSKLLPEFFANLIHARPNIQIFVTSGNHDGIGFLENISKYCLLTQNIHVVASMPFYTPENKTADDVNGPIEHRLLLDQIIYPLKNSSSKVEAYVVALPYLRGFDAIFDALDPEQISFLTENFPEVENFKNADLTIQYDALLRLVLQQVKLMNPQDLPVILMAHLNVLGSSTSATTIGGDDSVSPRIFAGFDYVALGHIHKEQFISVAGSSALVHYSGSPIPMNFGETDYHNSVSLLEIDSNAHQADARVKCTCLSVPRPVEFIRIPGSGFGKWSEIRSELLKIMEAQPVQNSFLPYVFCFIEPPAGAEDRDRIRQELMAMKENLVKVCNFCGYKFQENIVPVVRYSGENLSQSEVRSLDPKLMFEKFTKEIGYFEENFGDEYKQNPQQVKDGVMAAFDQVLSMVREENDAAEKVSQ